VHSLCNTVNLSMTLVAHYLDVVAHTDSAANLRTFIADA
jgi:hypothetical protein